MSKNYNNSMLGRPKDDISMHSKRSRKQDFSDEEPHNQSRRGKSAGATSRSVNEDTYLQRHLANRYNRDESVTDEERDGGSSTRRSNRSAGSNYRVSKKRQSRSRKDEDEDQP